MLTVFFKKITKINPFIINCSLENQNATGSKNLSLW